MKLLIIGHTLPEPTTTAAGTRMMQLIDWFLQEKYEIIWASTAMPSERSIHFDVQNIRSFNIQLNDPSLDALLIDEQPDVVLFDRFITEEQFGWRVQEKCPSALRILDTEDLHFLRKARHEAIKEGGSLQEVDLYTDSTKRELASILRCDLSLIISEIEIDLLLYAFQIPAGLLFYLPIWVTSLSETERDQLPRFSDRKNFIHIGNFKHAPNLDAVIQLKRSIWPQIREQLTNAELHIYGAYAPQQVIEMHQPKQGFFIQGWAANASEVLQQAKVLIAPLRFGAGLKGKIIEAMNNGTPTITTPIGAEGIAGDLPFAGYSKAHEKSLIEKAIQLYKEKDSWEKASQRGFDIIDKRFQRAPFDTQLKDRILEIHENITVHRQSHFLGQILQHHTLSAHKYMSKWIEEKNKDTPS